MNAVFVKFLENCFDSTSWRKLTREFTCVNLRDVSLCDVSLRNVSLRAVSFRIVTLRNVSLHCVNLRYVNLQCELGQLPV